MGAVKLCVRCMLYLSLLFVIHPHDVTAKGNVHDTDIAGSGAVEENLDIVWVSEINEEENYSEYSVSEVVQVSFHPSLLTIFEGDSGYVQYNLTYTPPRLVLPDPSFSLNPGGQTVVKGEDLIGEHVQLSSENALVASVMDHTLTRDPTSSSMFTGYRQSDYTQSGNQKHFTGNFSVKGLWLGRTNLSLYLTDGSNLSLTREYMVAVIRTPRSIDKIFNIVLTFIIIAANFMFGCLFDIESAKKILRRPVAPAIGFICQYTVMPTTSFLVGWALGLSIPLRLGLLAMGCSPGGGASNVWTLNLNGDVTLSLVMTFVSNMAALVMMPMWLLTLGQSMVGDSIEIPFLNIVITLAMFIFPILIGLGLNKWNANVGKIANKVIRPWTLIQIGFLLVVGLWSNLYIFQFCTDWRLLVAGMCLPYTGMAVGAIVATILKQSRSRIVTIGIETGFQNGALALVILRRALEQPEADITSVAPLIAVLMTPIPCIILFIILKIKRCCTPKSEKADSEELEDMVTNEDMVNNGDMLKNGDMCGDMVKNGDTGSNDDNQNTIPDKRRPRALTELFSSDADL